jgi:hypothetical protein
MLLNRPPFVTLALACLLAACATGPEVRVEPGSNVLEARRLLASTAAAGPVLVTWRGEPPLSAPALLAAVERGARGIDLDTTATGDAERRFVFDFTGGNETFCGEPRENRTAIRPLFVKAAFCDGERAVALAGAEPGGDPERLIWRLVGRLVPDDYPETYGFNLFGSRFSIGAGGTFGF